MTLPFAGHPVGARKPERSEGPRGPDRVGLPVPARRPDAVRQERADPPGARRDQRIDRALRDGHLLVRHARRDPRPRPTRSRSATPPARRPMTTARPTPPPLRDHLPLRVGRRSSAGARRSSRANGARPDHDRHVGVHLEARRQERRRPAPPAARLLVPEPASRGRGGRPGHRQPPWSPPGRGTWRARTRACIRTPRDELGAAQHIAQTSNRRLREDEFLVPLALTKGREAIRVRVRFTPVSRPLFPGQPRAARSAGARSATMPTASSCRGRDKTSSSRSSEVCLERADPWPSSFPRGRLNRHRLLGDGLAGQSGGELFHGDQGADRPARPVRR